MIRVVSDYQMESFYGMINDFAIVCINDKVAQIMLNALREWAVNLRPSSPPADPCGFEDWRKMSDQDHQLEADYQRTNRGLR